MKKPVISPQELVFLVAKGEGHALNEIEKRVYSGAPEGTTIISAGDEDYLVALVGEELEMQCHIGEKCWWATAKSEEWEEL